MPVHAIKKIIGELC